MMKQVTYLGQFGGKIPIHEENLLSSVILFYRGSNVYNVNIMAMVTATKGDNCVPDIGGITPQHPGK